MSGEGEEIPNPAAFGDNLLNLMQNWPEILRKHNRLFCDFCIPLMDIHERALAGESIAGDSFRARRLLLSLTKRELTRLLLEYGRADEMADMPWQLRLVDRPDTLEIKRRNLAQKQAEREGKREAFEESVVLRVTKYRKAHKVNLESALEAIANALDHADKPYSLKPKAFGVAKVRAAYMAGIKRAKARGYAIEKRGMIAPRINIVRLGDLTQKGRRKGTRGK